MRHLVPLLLLLTLGVASARDVHALARAGDIAEVRVALAVRYDPRSVNEVGQTVGEIALEAGHLELAQLLRAAELLVEVTGPAWLWEIESSTTEAGFFASAFVEAEDMLLVREAADGAEVLFRLQEHAGLVAHLEDIRLPGRWILLQQALVDVNEDGVPDVYFKGACECHGYVIHVLVDGISGEALSVDSYPYPSADGEIILHAYEFPPGTPRAMERFLARALAAETFASSLKAADVVREVRSTEP